LILILAYFVWVIRQTLAERWWTAILGGMVAVVVAGISYMALVLPIFLLFARVKGVAVV